jgi:hypothetical protein
VNDNPLVGTWELVAHEVPRADRWAPDRSGS